jgi:Domain of unknown function (DUF1707)
MGMSTQSSSSSRIRASDAEREEFAKAVREAVGAGRLNLDEGDERLAKIYAATYRDELRPFVADLPREDLVPGSWPGRPQPPRGPEDMRRFRAFVLARVASVALVVAGLVTLAALTGGHFFWPVFPLFFIGFLLLRRGLWWGRGWHPGYGYRHRYHQRPES